MTSTSEVEKNQSIYMIGKNQSISVTQDSQINLKKIIKEDKEIIIHVDLNIYKKLNSITKSDTLEDLLEILNLTNNLLQSLAQNTRDSLIPTNTPLVLNKIFSLIFSYSRFLPLNEMPKEKECIEYLLRNINKIKTEHENDMQKGHHAISILKNYNLIAQCYNFHHALTTNTVDNIIRYDNDKIFAKYKSSVFFNIFNNLFPYQKNIKIWALCASFEHELSSEDKIDYPNCVLKEEKLEKIFNIKNTEFLDSYRMQKFLNKQNNKDESMNFIRQQDALYELYNVYCLFNFNLILDYYIYIRNFPNKKNKLEEITNLYLKKMKIKTVVSTIIMDLVSKKFISKIRKEKIGKMEGFTEDFQIEYSDRLKDKKFKNTIFDFSDIVFSLFIMETNNKENRIYLSSDRGALIISNVYEIKMGGNIKIYNKLNNLIINEDNHRNYLEHYLSKNLNKTMPRMYKQSGKINGNIWYEKNQKIFSKLDINGGKREFVKMIANEYLPISLFQNLVLDEFIDKICAIVYSDSIHSKIMHSFKKNKVTISTKTGKPFVDYTLIPQICLIYLAWIKTQLAEKMQEKQLELFNT